MKTKTIGIVIIAMLMLFATMASALAAGTWTVTINGVASTTADGRYTQNQSVLVTCGYLLLDDVDNHYNFTNVTLVTDAGAAWAINQTYQNSTPGDNPANASYHTFNVFKASSQKSFKIGCQAKNITGSIIESTPNYTRTYDATVPTLGIDMPVFNPASKVTTATYYPVDTAAMSNCTMPDGSLVSVTSGTIYTDTTTETTSGNLKTYTITCQDRAGNSVSTVSSTYDAVWGSVITLGGNGGYSTVTETTTSASGETVTQQKIIKNEGMAINPIYIIAGVLVLGLVIVAIVVGVALSSKGKKGRRRR